MPNLVIETKMTHKINEVVSIIFDGVAIEIHSVEISNIFIPSWGKDTVLSTDYNGSSQQHPIGDIVGNLEKTHKKANLGILK